MPTRKKIKGFSGYYIDIQGKVWSTLIQHGRGRRIIEPDNFHEVKSHLTKCQYKLVSIWTNGRPKSLRVHRLVAQAFLYNNDPENKIYVCHKDGNHLNNNIENLYWVTPKENTADARKHGTMSRGEQRWNAKLNKDKIKLIRLLYKTFEWSQLRLAKIFGVGPDQISRIINFKRWKHI